jgi:adenylate kinase
MTVVVLLGPPGAGKGTQASVLAERMSLPHIATGDLFRAALRDRTPIGVEAESYMDRGELVPDGITVRMLLERLDEPDARTGAILDGFPRTPTQAEALEQALAERGSKVDVALEIDVPSEDLVRRVSARRICEAHGHPFNLETHPPQTEGVCDIDGSPLIHREDDRPETVRARLEQQLDSLAGVVAHYRRRGILRKVDGRPPIDDVTSELLTALQPAGGRA